MIKPGSFIKHERFIDVCIYVKKAYDYGHGMEIKAVWWNMGFTKSYCIGYRQRLNIAKNKTYLSKQRRTAIQDWEFLATRDQLFDCLRHAPWQEVKL